MLFYFSFCWFACILDREHFSVVLEYHYWDWYTFLRYSTEIAVLVLVLVISTSIKTYSGISSRRQTQMQFSTHSRSPSEFKFGYGTLPPHISVQAQRQGASGDMESSSELIPLNSNSVSLSSVGSSNIA